MSIERSDAVPPATSPDPAANGASGRPTPARDVEQQKLYLTAQCAKIRHWCRDLLDSSPAAANLPSDVARDLRDTPPSMSLDEVFAVFHRQRAAGLSFPDMDPDSPDPDVRRLSGERERLRVVLFTLMDAIEPYRPMTEAELRDMLEGPRGEPILDVIAELERELSEPS